MSKSNHDVIIEFITQSRNSYFRLAYSYVHNKEDALDIVQDSICKALSSAKTLENPSVMKTWFYRIVVNTALDYIRKSKRYVFVEGDVLEAVAEYANDQYEDIDLQKAIDRLPTLNKTVIMLRFFEGLKIEEIAQVMNENSNTTKSRLYSSLKKLKFELQETDY
jgi:RNA polymerase sigma-70 factor (ECF subfamily)